MTKIEEKFPGSEINSCLINKYVWELLMNLPNLPQNIKLISYRNCTINIFIAEMSVRMGVLCQWGKEDSQILSNITKFKVKGTPFVQITNFLYFE